MDKEIMKAFERIKDNVFCLPLHELTGLKIKTIRGFRFKTKRRKGFEPEYILFTDRKTIMQLVEQDCYTYHDCSSSARNIRVYQCEHSWKNIFNDTELYPVADKEIY